MATEQPIDDARYISAVAELFATMHTYDTKRPLLATTIANLVFEMNRCVMTKQQLNTAKMTADTSVMQTRSTFMIYPRHVWLSLHRAHVDSFSFFVKIYIQRLKLFANSYAIRKEK